MSVNEQPDQPIALAVPVPAQRIEQLGHFVLGQMLADAVVRISLAPNWSQNSAFNQFEMTRFHGHCLHVEIVYWSH